MNNNSFDYSSTYNPPINQPISSSSSSQGFSFSNMDWKIWLIIILLLAILGFNIFIYLAQGTQLLSNITKYFLGIFGTTTKQILNVSATGAKASVNVAAGTANAGLNVIQENTDNSSLNNALNNANASSKNPINSDSDNNGPTYQADDSYSSIQASKTSSKSGWCYIGEDRGVRSCINVGENDTCMSGDIFPSKEICINPNLRV